MVMLKAHYDGRAIIPDEPVELPRDQALVVQVEVAPSAAGDQRESVLDWAIQNAVDTPTVPQDLSHQHDHYLYGTPKKED